MKCRICKSDNAFVSKWHERDGRRAWVVCRDCGATHVRPLSEWELIEMRNEQPQSLDEVLHDMERMELHDEEMDRVHMFWRRFLFFLGSTVAAVLLWAAMQ